MVDFQWDPRKEDLNIQKHEIDFTTATLIWLAESSRPEGPTSVKKGSSKQKSRISANRPRTDWARIDALTDEQIEAAVRDDPDAPPLVDEEWFATATLVMPRSKEQISIRLDRDVLEHFRRHPRYQTRINAILRAAMKHEKKAG